MRPQISVTVGCKDCGKAYKGAVLAAPWADARDFDHQAKMAFDAAMKGARSICICPKPPVDMRLPEYPRREPT